MVLNKDYIKKTITNNTELDEWGNKVYKPVPYRWSHGAMDEDMGDGLIIYSLIQFMRSKVCVCLGSGGGFIPRIMTQARRDLWEQKVWEGNPDYNWGDIGCTFIVDAMNNVGGNVDWFDKDSFFRSQFYPRVISETTYNAFNNFFVLQDIKIDYLHIDAGHSYENVKEDFELYTQLLSDTGVVTIHDTDPDYHDKFIVTQEVKDRGEHDDWSGPIRFVKELDRNEWDVLNLFNFGIQKNKPSSTGITIIKKR